MAEVAGFSFSVRDIEALPEGGCGPGFSTDFRFSYDIAELSEDDAAVLADSETVVCIVLGESEDGGSGSAAFTTEGDIEPVV